MQVGVLGVNHKSAELHLRELLAKACHKRFSSKGVAHLGFAFVLLSTCNRTELYFSSEDLAATHSYLLRLLRTEVEEPFEHKLYSYFGSDCFTHLCRVTVGLDSAILAETEIQGQVKTAYEMAMTYSTLPRELHFMFQKSLKIGKEVRSSLGQFFGALSLEETIFSTSQMLFKNMRERRLLLVGASEINLKILSFLKAKGIEQITLCNRTTSKAEEVAKQERVSSIPWQSLSTWIHYDLVVFGTKAPGYLLEFGQLPLVLSQKLIVDLSVPRNVDPQVEQHPQIQLLNMDQINRHIEEKSQSQLFEVELIESAVIDLVSKQILSFRTRERAREERFHTSKLAILGA